MKIVFTRDYDVKAVDGPSYKEGQVHEFPEASAWHYLNRGVAKQYVEEKAVDKPSKFGRRKSGPDEMAVLGPSEIA